MCVACCVWFGVCCLSIVVRCLLVVGCILVGCYLLSGVRGLLLVVWFWLFGLIVCFDCSC